MKYICIIPFFSNVQIEYKMNEVICEVEYESLSILEQCNFIKHSEN